MRLKASVDYFLLRSVWQWYTCPFDDRVWLCDNTCGLDIPFTKENCSPEWQCFEACSPAYVRSKMESKQRMKLKNKLTVLLKPWLFIIMNLWYYQYQKTYIYAVDFLKNCHSNCVKSKIKL